jgi:hypothetical protein
MVNIVARPDDEYGHTMKIDWDRIKWELDRRRKRRPWTPAHKATVVRRGALDGGSRYDG